MSRLAHILPPLIVACSMIGAMLWTARRTSRAGIAEANDLGLETSEVEREILSSLTHSVRRGRCLRSRLTLPDGHAASMRPWRLLQRAGAKHPQLPSGWRVDGLPTPLPPVLRTAFVAVTEEWKERLFEAEGTATDVCAYWDGFHGAREARAVRDHLDRIVAALSEHAASRTA